MNTEKQAKEPLTVKSMEEWLAKTPIEPMTKLECMTEEDRADVDALAVSGTIDQTHALLEDYGYEVSRATVARHVKDVREKASLEERERLVKHASKLTEGNEGEKLRTGSLEALRQRIFDRALESRDGGEGLKMYSALVAEEEKLKQIALQREKLQLQCEALELQRERMLIEAARGNGRLYVEALRILRDERLEDRVKVAQARERLLCLVEEKLPGEATESSAAKMERATEG